MTHGALNVAWARTFLSAVHASGVDTVVIAPGSRSTPLVLAADALPGLRTIVHLDERSAAFFALGIGKATGRPAAVVTTSGTAVANLYPAVVEAAASETPLLLLTADRPRRLRGTDANQTIDQIGLFGSDPVAFLDLPEPVDTEEAWENLVGWARDAAEAAAGGGIRSPAGPVHVNLPFDKPLHPLTPEESSGPEEGSDRAPHAVSDGGFPRELGSGPEVASDGHEAADDLSNVLASISRARRGLIAAGPVPAAASLQGGVAALARATGFPLLADPLSGARFLEPDPALRRVELFDLVLRDPEARNALAPDLVLRVGRAPTSAALNAFLAETDAEVVVLDVGGRWTDHTGGDRVYARVDPAAVASALPTKREPEPALRLASEPATEHPSEPASEDAWWGRWHAADQAAREAVAAREASESVLPSGAAEPVSTRAAVAAVPEDGLVFVSSSMPVRDVDTFVAGGRRIQCLGNRGASGIDGIVSTALGAAYASARPTLALIGDLAFLHDLNGLIPARELGLPVVFLVLNNQGGGIFHMLPIRHHEPAFTRYFATPHALDFRHAAALYDLPYVRVAPAEVGSAVAAAFAEGGPHVLEVRSDREENRRWRKTTAEVVRSRMAAIAQHGKEDR